MTDEQRKINAKIALTKYRKTQTYKDYRRQYRSTEEYKDKRRDKELQKKFGISIIEYKKMLEAQGGICKICGGTGQPKDKTRILAVDHDHNTGEIRGLLCRRCNVVLGLMEDNTEYLLNAINYLYGGKYRKTE